MFTSVPTSFAAFGFDGSWDVFEAFSPVNDIGVAEPFIRAARWLEQELANDRQGPRFVMIHARGGHPPWDVSREDAQHLKPPEYSGALDPRRGAMVLSALRARSRRNARRLTDDDWIRMRELVEASLLAQDKGLRNLLGVLKAKDALDSTLLIVVGDVAPADAPELPYDPAGSLTEDRLSVPLLVRFPGPVLGRTEVNDPSSAADIPFTVLTALGLRGEGMTGIDLFERAHGRSELTGTAQVASLPGRYATRLGPWLLRGELGDVPTLCALDVDPVCLRDVFGAHSIAARASWLSTFSAEQAAMDDERIKQVAAEFDRDTRAALAVWGDIPP
jgi:arylsulfatase A-like enzyme